MINKSHIWFLTLTSIIIVLAGYYIAVPKETLKNVFETKEENNNIKATVKESEALTALRITKEENLLKSITSLQETLLKTNATIDEKNEAYENIKFLNTNSSLEEKLEKIINDTHKVTSFVEIKDTNVLVVIANKKDNYTLANNIIRTVNNELKENYYVTVRFE